MMPNLPPPVKPMERQVPPPERKPPAMGGGGCPLYQDGQCTFLNTPVADLVQMQQDSEEQGESPQEQKAEGPAGEAAEQEQPA